jgi:voltage-gated potassium channel
MMMIGGIGLIGFVTGSLASWIVDRISAGSQTVEKEQQEVGELAAEIRQLRLEIAQLRAEVRGDGQP